MRHPAINTRPLTLGAIEITPGNSIERSFNIFCLLLALLCGSTLISVLSATMVDLQMSHQERIRQLRLLRRYLLENGVSSNLAMQVQRQAMGRFAVQTRIAKEDVGALEIISRSLQKQLHREVCEPKLVGHPFFRMMRNMDASWFENLLSTVVKVEMFRADDDIFFGGTQASVALHISYGEVSYTQEARFSPDRVPQTWSLGAGTWLCECALWSEWVHVGNARAVSTCELLVIDAERFLDALDGHRVVACLAAEYGHGVHLRVKEARPPLGWWPNDLETPFAECADVVSMMSRSARQSIAMIAAETARGQHAWTAFWGARRTCTMRTSPVCCPRFPLAPLSSS